MFSECPSVCACVRTCVSPVGGILLYWLAVDFHFSITLVACTGGTVKQRSNVSFSPFVCMSFAMSVFRQ